MTGIVCKLALMYNLASISFTSLLPNMY
jgi:hypothetical protein